MVATPGVVARSEESTARSYRRGPGWPGRNGEGAVVVADILIPIAPRSDRHVKQKFARWPVRNRSGAQPQETHTPHPATAQRASLPPALSAWSSASLWPLSPLAFRVARGSRQHAVTGMLAPPRRLRQRSALSLWRGETPVNR